LPLLLLLYELVEEALTTDCFGFLALARLLYGSIVYKRHRKGVQ
jgi:hypothetical protein